MSATCCMYVQTFDGFKERKEYDSYGAMKYEAYCNKNDRVLYWWCELEELEKRWKNDPAAD